ncbi:hypothetical protein O9X94_00575 [Agrobacterium leguminum]|uniref:Uncharacterized protein n=1 Tax=Agrobacterium leguminum TaxID=2792015 RepID=A0A9X3KCU5_9HYPH|nr:hypothetical protein [Agrobacterium leguminum]MCZ7907786.1 hypothetical protein [Agrobacterium leguminum]
MHKLLIERLCEIGHLAEMTCRNWTGDRSGIETVGAEFVLSYELAKHLNENRELLGIERIGFNLALCEIAAFEKGFLKGRMAGRNTKRRYFVLYHTDGTNSVIRAQQYFDIRIINSEAKGVARALNKHPAIHSAVILGIACFSDSNPPGKLLSNVAAQLRDEFSIDVEMGFTLIPKANLEGFYVFAIICQPQRKAVIA